MSINVVINGKPEELDQSSTLAELLKLKGVRLDVVTVELNDKIIEKKVYDSTFIKQGDRLEFVYYMGGGQDVSQLIGKTPMVKLVNVVDKNAADIYAKVEFFSPGGSIKDRICLAMIEAAEKSGQLLPGGVIVEPTSGNTGIGLAMIGASRGYKIILTMPETMSLERIYIIKSYGAEVILTPGVEGMNGAIKKAEELLKKTPNSFTPQQFKNLANPEIHRKTTAREILTATAGKLDAFV